MAIDNLKPTLADWKKKLKEVEIEELPKAMARVGESAATGDWQENAEYEDAERQLEVVRTRISDIRALISTLEKSSKKR